MTYPMDGLAVIAPILFMVMIIGFPLIGLAVGWKRALYWGGGNFLFYVIGLIVWKCAGGAIGTSIAELLKNMIPALKDVSVTKLATSVAAPVFFLIVLIVANLLLLINYYAWFKRVAKIKFDIAARKAIKAAKKEYKAKGKKVPDKLTVTVTLKDKDGVKVTEKPYSVRAGNRLIGLASMEMLMLPVTLSLTNAVFYTTTSSSTRATNGFAEGLYNSLNQSDKALSWFSYYGGTSGDDFDGLFSGLELSTEEIPSKLYVTDPNSGEQIEVKVTEEGEKATVLDLVTNNVVEIATNELVDNLKSFDEQTATNKYTDAYNAAIAAGQPAEQAEKTAIAATNSFLGEAAVPINKLAGIWNVLVDQCQLPLQALFNSGNITDLIKQIIEKQLINDLEKIEITDDILDDIFGDDRESGLYFSIVEQYTTALENKDDTAVIAFDVDNKHFEFKITVLKQLFVQVASINNLKELAMSFVTFDTTLPQTDIDLFNSAVDNVISLILLAQ